MKDMRVIIGIMLAVIIGLVVLLVVISTSLTPDQTNPAYDVAIEFSNRSAKGDESALDLLSPDLKTYVAENCPEGKVSACVQAYTPEDWGGILSAVYRRAIPDDGAWDVLLVATYAENQGFSGVCIYNRVERIVTDKPDDAYSGWRVTAWSGFISCDEPNAGLSDLLKLDAPNRVP